jgi:hypothetical protein
VLCNCCLARACLRGVLLLGVRVLHLCVDAVVFARTTSQGLADIEAAAALLAASHIDPAAAAAAAGPSSRLHQLQHQVKTGLGMVK